MNQIITKEQIKAKLDLHEAITLVEALPPKYFAAEHLPGAINIPHDEIKEKAATLLPDKGAMIVVYCSNAQCQNSAIAANTLQQLGYQNVYKYAEGKQDWLAAGFAVESA